MYLVVKVRTATGNRDNNRGCRDDAPASVSNQ